MKIRNGFVSNSSSSSFIVLLKHKPKDVKDLMNMLFPDFEPDYQITGEIEDVVKPITVEEVCARVFQDIIHKQKGRYNCYSLQEAMGGYITEVDEESIVKLYDKSYAEANSIECNLWNELNRKCNPKGTDLDYGKLIILFKKEKELYKKWHLAKKNDEKARKEWEKERKKETKEFYNKFKAKYPKHKFECVLEYGDRHGEYVLETGDIFRNVPHITISNH